MYYDKISFEDPRFPVRVLPFHSPSGRRTKDGELSPSYHEQLEILLFLEGETGITVKDRTFVCAGGDIAIVNPGELHRLYKVSSPSCYHVVMLDTLLLGAKDDLTNEKYIRPFEERTIVFNNFIRDDTLRQSVETIVEEMTERKSCYELAVKAEIYKILTVLNRSYAESEITHKEKELRLKQARVIEKSMEYIKENLREQISLADISSSLSISEYHFSRLFKKQTGMTVFEYIKEQRMALAKKLLSRGELSVSEVAERCGYNDSSYFSKNFKQATGFTPGKFIAKEGH